MPEKLIPMNRENLKIERASTFDTYKIVKMIFDYHKEDPIVQAILSSSLKSYFFRVLGPVYMSLKFENFKATINGRLVGYLIQEFRFRNLSAHVHFIGVHPDYRGQGIGTSLMEFAESLAQGKYPYLTLDTHEDNTAALRLYKKRGFVDLQMFQTCFKLREIGAPKMTCQGIKLQTISGEKAILCRNKYFLKAVESVSGSDGSEIATKMYLSPKLSRGPNRYEIIASDAQIGYAAIERKKNLASIFFELDPTFWGTDIEVAAVKTVVEHGFKASTGETEIYILQAYEKPLTQVLNKMGYVTQRQASRVALMKKLDRAV